MPFLTTKPYKRHEEHKGKIGQERSFMQQADYQFHRPSPRMHESVSMHKTSTPVRDSCMNQARSEEEETSVNPLVLRDEESCDYTLNSFDHRNKKMTFKNQSSENHEKPFASLLKANFITIHE